MASSLGLLEESVLFQIIGEDGKNKLKEHLVDIICKEVEFQLTEMDTYIISPYDIDNIYLEIMNEVKREVALEWKAKLKKAIDAKMEKTLGDLVEETV